MDDFVSGPGANVSKSSTLPLPHRLNVDRPASSMAAGRERDRDRERDGYYSDRNELVREREKERERERGYLSDHNSRYSYSNALIFTKLLSDSYSGICV